MKIESKFTKLNQRRSRKMVPIKLSTNFGYVLSNNPDHYVELRFEQDNDEELFQRLQLSPDEAEKLGKELIALSKFARPIS